MAQQEQEELRGKAKLAFEACAKILEGKKLVGEGTLELNNLFGEHSLKSKPKAKNDNLTSGQKSALTKKTKKKLIAHRETSTFKVDKRKDEALKNKMVDIVRVNRQASTALFMKKLKLSERRVNRLLGQLEGKGQLVDVGNKEEGAHHKWVLPEKKEINGHKLAKTPGGGTRNSTKKTVGGRGQRIDVTDEALVTKAKEFLSTNDWVNKGKFIDAIQLSPGPANRLIDYMKKQKIIKEVQKKNNPEHDKHGTRKLLPRFMPYLELA